MTLNEVISLLEAGFTKDEIQAFEQTGNTPADPVIIPTETPAEPEAEPEKEPAKIPEAEPVKTLPDSPVITALNENIAKLIKTIQSSNLANNSIDKPATADINKQVDTIMESIIRPIKEVNNK